MKNDRRKKGKKAKEIYLVFLSVHSSSLNHGCSFRSTCASFASSRFSSGSSPFPPLAGSSGRFAWFYSLAERMRFVRPSNQFEVASWKGGEDRLRNRNALVEFFEFLSARETINQISVVEMHLQKLLKYSLLFSFRSIKLIPIKPVISNTFSDRMNIYSFKFKFKFYSNSIRTNETPKNIISDQLSNIRDKIISSKNMAAKNEYNLHRCAIFKKIIYVINHRRKQTSFHRDA